MICEEQIDVYSTLRYVVYSKVYLDLSRFLLNSLHSLIFALCIPQQDVIDSVRKCEHLLRESHAWINLTPDIH